MAGKKRKHDDQNGGDSADALYSNKARNRPSADAPINPTYGQRCAIPGLDDDTAMEGDEEELNYDEDMDALAYLKAVRQEASGIPNLLVAPRTPPNISGREIYENGDGDFRGYYKDGAYVASSQQALESFDSAEAEELDQQVQYFDSIIARYEALRTQLQQIPPLEAIQDLGSDHPTHIAKLTLPVARWWKWKMRTKDPKPAQVATMDKPTVLRLLGLLARGTTLSRGAEVEIGVSRWVWSLLAKLPHRGELTSEEIGVVRELGKKAVLIGVGLRKNSNWEQGMREVERDFDNEAVDEFEHVPNEDEIPLDSEFEDDDEIFDATPTTGEVSTEETIVDDSLLGPQVAMPAQHAVVAEDPPIENGAPGSEEHRPGSTLEETGELSSESSDEGALEAARARLLGQLERENDQADQKKHAAVWNTRATVDMIITVAGEIYGQRDLLEFRGAWDE